MPLVNPTSSNAALPGGQLSKPAHMPKLRATFPHDGTNRADAAGFFTQCNDNGVAVDSDFTANTYKSIANVSGAGELTSVVGPVATGTETTTFEITLDGTLYEIAFTLATNYRAILGRGHPSIDDGTAPYGLVQDLNTGDFDSAKRLYVVAGNIYMPHPYIVRANGWPRLRFDTSLLVRIKHSAGITDTAAQGRQSAVCYILD